MIQRRPEPDSSAPPASCISAQPCSPYRSAAAAQPAQPFGVIQAAMLREVVPSLRHAPCPPAFATFTCCPIRNRVRGIEHHRIRSRQPGRNLHRRAMILRNLHRHQRTLPSRTTRHLHPLRAEDQRIRRNRQVARARRHLEVHHRIRARQQLTGRVRFTSTSTFNVREAGSIALALRAITPSNVCPGNSSSVSVRRAARPHHARVDLRHRHKHAQRPDRRQVKQLLRRARPPTHL